MSLSDTTAKRILVTGANKGIGKAICARLLTEWKDTHVLVGTRDLERGKLAIRELIQECGPECEKRLQLLKLDTGDDQSVKDAAQSIAAEPKLYGIINNAGVRS